MKQFKVKNAEGIPVAVSEAQYRELVGDRTTAPYTNKVYSGEMTIEKVPENIRDAVVAIVEARIAFFGECHIPAKQALAELRSALE